MNNYRNACEKAGVRTVEEASIGEDFEGLAYLVTVLVDNDMVEDDSWIVGDIADAEDHARCIIAEFCDPDVSVTVSEVFVDEDTVEGSGYMTDRVFRFYGELV